MEQVPDVYKRPYDADFPVVCMDESPEQLIETVCEEQMEVGKDKRLIMNIFDMILSIFLWQTSH